MDNFVDRDKIFKKFDESFLTNQKVIIKGFAGVGKSSCALEYSYKKQGQSYEAIRWFDASSRITLDNAYYSLAEELDINVSDKKSDMLIRLIYQELVVGSKNLLFIFDNVQKEDEICKKIDYIKDYLLNLPLNIKVIITTRDANLTDNVKDKMFELLPFTREQGIKYAKDSLALELSNEQAVKLVEEVSLLPLRLKGAIQYLRDKTSLQAKLTNSELDELIKSYKKSNNEANLLLKSIDKTDNMWTLLQYASYLDCDFIDIEVIKKLLKIDANMLADYVNKLSKLSLIGKVHDNGVVGLTMHSLIQQDIREEANKFVEGRIGSDKISNDLLETLNKLMPNVTNVSGKDWQLASRLESNIVLVLECAYNNNLSTQAQLYKKLADYYEYVNCDKQKNLEYHLQALKIYQNLHTGNHPDIATTLSNVGRAYENTNENKFLEYSLKALEMRQALYKGNHADTARSLNNVGIAYEEMGETNKGLVFKEKALIMRQAISPHNPQDIANSLNNVGISYGKIGDRAKSIEYMKQSYTIHSKLADKNDTNYKSLVKYLSFALPDFLKKNESREIIKQKKELDYATIKVKHKIQDVLDKIHELAAEGIWSTGLICSRVILKDWGVNGYINESYLSEKIGKRASEQGVMDLAKMLCFEAICLGIMGSEKKDFTCVTEFAKAYPELVNKIISEHPEYFVDGSILRSCVNNPSLIIQLLVGSFENTESNSSEQSNKEEERFDPESKNINTDIREEEVAPLLGEINGDIVQ